MKLKIEIELDNEAFGEELATESIRILRKCIKELQYGTERVSLRDFNGNTCGRMEVSE